VLWSELGPLYAAAAAGMPPNDSTPELQMPDVAAWLEARERSDPAPAPVTIDATEADLPRPFRAVAGHAGKRVELELASDITDQLTRGSARIGATPFEITLSAFALLLRRLTGRRDVAFGTPRTVREGAGFEGLVGYLLEMSAVRLEVGPDSTLRSLLAQ